MHVVLSRYLSYNYHDETLVGAQYRRLNKTLISNQMYRYILDLITAEI